MCSNLYRYHRGVSHSLGSCKSLEWIIGRPASPNDAVVIIIALLAHHRTGCPMEQQTAYDLLAGRIDYNME